MLKVQVTDISTLPEPRTAASAAAEFAGFLDDTALGAYRSQGRPRACWCLCDFIGQNTKTNTQW